MLWKATLVFSSIVDGTPGSDLFEEETWVFDAKDADDAAFRASELLKRGAEEYINAEKNLLRWEPVAYHRLELLGSWEECQRGVEVESRFVDKLPEELW